MNPRKKHGLRLVLSLILLLAAGPLAGNNAQRITGTLIDRERNVLAGGTVRCFVGDTAFVAGTTANASCSTTSDIRSWSSTSSRPGKRRCASATS